MVPLMLCMGKAQFCRFRIGLKKYFLFTHHPRRHDTATPLDAHASNLSIGLIDKAIENNVILLCLPPHTTHMLQPLDVAV